jgi:hypothetical protein
LADGQVPEGFVGDVPGDKQHWSRAMAEHLRLVEDSLAEEKEGYVWDVVSFNQF